ncbi:MAG: hypothetical protein ACKOD3_07875, partial [Phenylobacterium sp.]
MTHSGRPRPAAQAPAALQAGALPAREPATRGDRGSTLGRRTMAKKPLRVAVTGAAGNIGYALLFRI